jgi:hypothetical protein
MVTSGHALKGLRTHGAPTRNEDKGIDIFLKSEEEEVNMQTTNIHVMTGRGVGIRCRLAQQGPARAIHPIDIGSARQCYHVLSGRTEAPKLCIWNHECYHCAFDQLLDNFDFVRATELAPSGLEAA